MTFEFWCLLGAIVVGLIHISAASFSFKAQVGNGYTVGSRDEGLAPQGMAGRLSRANTNFIETFALFAACVLLVHLTGTSGLLSRLGCVLYLGGRIVYLPLYAAGVPWLRTFSWNIATLGIVIAGAQCVVGSWPA